MLPFMPRIARIVVSDLPHHVTQRGNNHRLSHIKIKNRDSHLLFALIVPFVMLSIMPRVARIVVPGLPHHITQRGNNRQDVFFVDDDRRVYMRILKQQSQKYNLSIISYCLMTNHVHLVAIPKNRESLALAVGRTHWLYTKYINRLHNRSGHLWQNRFFSFAMDADHFIHAARYVERNPVRARLVRLPWRYQWSSAAAHIGHSDKSGLLNLIAWRNIVGRRNWQSILQQPEDEDQLVRVRSQTQTGRPIVSDSLLSKLEHKLGRRLRTAQVGRPRVVSSNAKTKRKKARGS